MLKVTGRSKTMPKDMVKPGVEPINSPKATPATTARIF
jgi:hypothetical protein